MALEITKEHLDNILQHGEQTFPHECCGFLLGKDEKKHRRILEVVAADNAREDDAKRRRFLITPELFIKTEKYAREKSWELLGFYHSHPNAEARPSAYDTEHAWPWYSYVISSIMDGHFKETTSWILRDDRSLFDQEKIIII